MSTNSNVEPISLTEHRAARQTAAMPNAGALTADQRRAYRQLAIHALGLDVATLTRTLRARRLERMPELRLLPPADIAA
jgi:uncharacterized protein YlxW (UPF0749 family)